MRALRPTFAHLLLVTPWFGEAMAGYLSVSMTPATQCNSSVVTWTGDDGPYHLLLTPTDFNQHGYNVWVPEIPANQTNYTIPINQPAGASFLLTMWGKSGISYAGTSDVMTVAPSNVTSCFLTDAEILGLYTFSFNITDTYDGYPPQCGNLTMTWPTSLESNVTSGLARRGSLEDNHSADKAVRSLDEELDSYEERDESSGNGVGNTTYPPTMFGIIPLGNSFSIPITYGYDTPIAQNLPNTSLSYNPSTWTSHGVTSLNWTVEMAKGTRFILVAGIGSEKQWASGGSSRMLTVGQGDMSCLYTTPEDPDPPPSITGSSTATSTASPPPETQPANSGSKSTLSASRIAIASAVSVCATLLLVGIFFLCRRRFRRRAEGRYTAEPYSPGKSTARLGAMSPEDTRLDLLHGGIPPSSRNLSRIQTATEPTSPTGSNPFLDSPNRVSDRDTSRGYALAERTLSTDDTWSTPASPSRDSYPSRMGFLQAGYSEEMMNRSASRDALLRQQTASPAPFSPIDGVPTMPGARAHRPPPGAGALRLHGDGPGDGTDELEDEEEDITTLKRDTLAYLGDQAGGSRAPGTRRPARRRTEETPTEYVVHRDAGRIRPPQVELPPRYDELQWEEAEREQHESRTT